MASAFDWDLRKRIENRYTATNLLSVCVCIPYPIARFKRTRALRLFDTESFIKSVTANISARLRVARQFPSCNLDTGKKRTLRQKHSSNDAEFCESGLKARYLDYSSSTGKKRRTARDLVPHYETHDRENNTTSFRVSCYLYLGVCVCVRN